MSSFRKVYLVYFPMTNKSYGIWYPEALRSMCLVRSIEFLHEHLEFDNNALFNKEPYELINGSPEKEEVDGHTYNLIFNRSKPLPKKDFNKVKKFEI